MPREGRLRLRAITITVTYATILARIRWGDKQVRGVIGAGCCDPKSDEDHDMSEQEDKTKGTLNKVAGEAKDKLGDATDNQDLQNEGKGQKLKGHGQDAKGEAKGALKDKD